MAAHAAARSAQESDASRPSAQDLTPRLSYSQNLARSDLLLFFSPKGIKIMKIKIMGFGRRGRALFLHSLSKLEILTGDPRKETLSGMESFPDPELDPWKSLPWELLGAGGFSAGGSQEGSPRGGQMGTGKPKDPHFDPSAFRSAAGAPSTPPCPHTLPQHQPRRTPMAGVNAVCLSPTRACARRTMTPRPPPTTPSWSSTTRAAAPPPAPSAPSTPPAPATRTTTT